MASGEGAPEAVEVTLYLDVYFLVNFLADLLLLGIVGRLFGLRRPALRLCLGAAAGAAWACAAALLFLPSGGGCGAAAGMLLRAAGFVFRIPLPAALMLLAAFGRAAPPAFALRLAALFVSGVFLGGGLELAAQRPGGVKSLPVWLAAAVLPSLGLHLFLGALAAFRSRTGTFFRVTLENGGRSVQVTALLDSGNRLFEPYGRCPVHVVDQQAAAPLRTRANRAVLIPYRSVGREGGLLWGFRIERMTAEGEDGSRRVFERPWIALSGVRLSPEGRYEMLLHGGGEAQRPGRAAHFPRRPREGRNDRRSGGIEK